MLVFDVRWMQEDLDIVSFYVVMQVVCDLYSVVDYEVYKVWCEDYFFLKYCNEFCGIGGIFYDYLNSGEWDVDFVFIQDVGCVFLDIYLKLVWCNF